MAELGILAAVLVVCRELIGLVDTIISLRQDKLPKKKGRKKRK